MGWLGAEGSQLGLLALQKTLESCARSLYQLEVLRHVHEGVGLPLLLLLLQLVVEEVLVLFGAVWIEG